MNPSRIMNQSHTDSSRSSNQNENQINDEIINQLEKFYCQYATDQEAREKYLQDRAAKTRQLVNKSEQMKKDVDEFEKLYKSKFVYKDGQFVIVQPYEGNNKEEQEKEKRDIEELNEKKEEQEIKEEKVQIRQNIRNAEIRQENKLLQLSKISERNLEDELSQIIEEDKRTAKQLVNIYSNNLKKFSQLAQNIQKTKAQDMLDQQYKYLQKRQEEKIDQGLNQKVQEIKKKIKQLRDEEKALNDLIQLLLQKRKAENDLEQVQRQKQMRENERRALERKENERRIVFEEINKEKREKYKQIHKYLKQQEMKVKQLETSRNEKQAELTKLSQETSDFEHKQKQLYKEKYDFQIQNIVQARNLNSPSNLRTNSLIPNRVRPQSQLSFLSQDIGSAILPNPASTISDQQSRINDSTTSINQQPQSVQCKVQQNLFDELRQKLLLIFMLVSLIVMVWKL